MPYYAPGDPNPRKTPAEFQADQDARPVTKKIDDELQSIASEEPDYVYAAMVAFGVIALMMVAVWWAFHP
jgi:hypothetical protein